VSKSFKKPIYSTFCSSRGNKWARSHANRVLRKVNKRNLKKTIDYDVDFVETKLREVSDVWCFPSDGLAHYSYSSIDAIASELWSEIQAALNSKRELRNFRSGYYDAECICELLERPTSIESLESLSAADVKKVALHKYYKLFRRR